jgi:hypothetical protein
MAAGQKRREGNEFRPQDHRPLKRALAVQMDDPLQRAGRKNPARFLATDQPRRAACLAYTRGQ